MTAIKALKIFKRKEIIKSQKYKSRSYITLNLLNWMEYKKKKMLKINKSENGQ